MDAKTALRMRKKYEKNPTMYVIQSRPIGSNDEWRNDSNPSWMLLDNDYRIVTANSDKIKPKQRVRRFFISKNEQGRIYVNNDLYKILREDKDLYIELHDYKLEYQDVLTDEVGKLEETLDISNNDKNSLIMINKFLASVASGIRRPSDKDVASEMRKYLTSFISSHLC